MITMQIDSDTQAWSILSPNFFDDKGIIRRKSIFYNPRREDFSAIDYLCDEWDYEWEGI